MTYDRKRSLKDNLTAAEKEFQHVKSEAHKMGVFPPLENATAKTGMAEAMMIHQRNIDTLRACMSVARIERAKTTSKPKPATTTPAQKPAVKEDKTSPLVFDCRHPITGKTLKETRHV